MIDRSPRLSSEQLACELSSLQRELNSQQALLTRNEKAMAQQNLVSHILELLNQSGDESNVLREILSELKAYAGVEAAGLRLQEGFDYPYQETNGFSPDFIRSENFICARDAAGNYVRDQNTLPVLECMCGSVIRGRIDPALPFFTHGGSFWTNDILDLASSARRLDWLCPMRSGCTRFGYKSMALIPLRSHREIFGLIQFNGCRRGAFNPAQLIFLERIGFNIGVALSRRRAEEELLRSRKRLAEAERIANLGSWEWDIPANRLFWSEGVCRIFGIEPRRSEAPYAVFLKAVHPEDRGRVERAINAALQGGGGYDLDHRIVLRGGRVRTVHERGEVVFASGRPVRMFGTVQDITERKRAETALSETELQLRHAQKMEAIGRLAGAIAHDFNNTLLVIIGYTDILLGKLRKGDPLRENLREILAAGESAADLTRQLLAFSRSQPRTPRVLDLGRTLLGKREMLGRLIGEDIELVLDCRLDLGCVKIDPGQLEQVLMNLAVNARDAMPEGGRLLIATDTVEVGEECARHLASQSPGFYLMLTVADTGCGMDEETRARAFEPFFTTKGEEKGTGLGLSTVYGIVTQNGGDISVRSEPGSGTTFRILLPRHDAAPSAVVEKPASAPAGGTETVLVAEDNDPLRLLILSILKEGGYTVLEACNGAEALKICKQHPGTIDLLISDVVMPQLSGRQLADQVRQMRSGIKVLLSSGYEQHTLEANNALDSGIDFIEKRYTPNALLNKVREVLDTRS